MTGRRRFFSTLAGASGAALALTHGAAPARADAGMGSMPVADRIKAAQQFRMRAAAYYEAIGAPSQPNNGDEARYPARINSFSKTLQHNHLGEVDSNSYDSMIRAVNSGRNEDFDAVLRGGNVRLKNPMAAFTYQYTGADQCQFVMPPAPAFDSAEQAGEMVELYWQALTRDVPFAEYDTHPLIADAAHELSRMTDFRGPKQNGRVTPRTLFRGSTAADLVGPYVSQFLLLPALAGSIQVDQKQSSLARGRDFMTAHGEWLEIQLGLSKGPAARYDTTPRYIRSARDLVHFVHTDYSYSPYYLPTWLLIGYGPLIYDESNPYTWSRSNDSFVTFGPIDAFEFIARAVKPAFNAAWWQKWMVHRRARPEVFAGRVHFHMLKNAVYPIHNDVLESSAIERTARTFGSYFLAQAYPEGSPAHSAYPSGHATVAGAVITMMKAFYREDYVIPEPVTSSADGLKLEPWTGEALTVGGELNKLASNIATARNCAGIHWRTDAWEGMKLGEQVALTILRDVASSYAEGFGGFELTTLDGRHVTICGYC
jgi:hypothetical protein